MDNGEICRTYKAAKNHKMQVSILAELNCCSKDDIAKILKDNGFTLTFNTNGVDVSVKADEIKELHDEGHDIRWLAQKYHVSMKGISEILGTDVPEEEHKETETAQQESNNVSEELKPTMPNYEKQAGYWEGQAKKLTVNYDKLVAQITSLKSELKEAKSTNYNEQLYELRVQNTKLSATVDVLLGKIAAMEAERKRND